MPTKVFETTLPLLTTPTPMRSPTRRYNTMAMVSVLIVTKHCLSSSCLSPTPPTHTLQPTRQRA
ncbi:hypothetical protein DAI22_03g088700 [Oryza sativa Japonica Group]|nr:hypothetical protein DAI22_03g088700 [Oryza sativa Japonica Group]